MAWSITGTIPNRFKNGVLLDNVAAPPSGITSAGPSGLYGKSDGGIYVNNGIQSERVLNGNGVGRPSGNGQYGWTCDPSVAINATTSPNTGRIYCFAMDWFVSRTIGTLYYYVHTVGATLTTGRNWVALYDGLSGTRLWVSPDQTTAFTSTGLKTLTGLNTLANTNSTGRLIAAFMSTGTTPAILRGNNAGGPLSNLGLNDASGYSAWLDPTTGQTTMPTTLNVFPTAPSLVNNVFFCVGP